MLTTRIEAYECPKCGTLWPSNTGALDCCDSWIRRPMSFQCGQCGLIFAEFELAEECCQRADIVYHIVMHERANGDG